MQSLQRVAEAVDRECTPRVEMAATR